MHDRLPRRGPAALILLICVCAAVGTSAPAATSAIGSQASVEFVADELIVQFEPGADEPRRANARAAVRASVLRRLQRLGVERLRLPRQTHPLAAIQALRGRPHVRAVQLNYKRSIASQQMPNDTYWLDGSLWALSKIGAHAAWSTFGPGSATVVVANIDTGVNYGHPDLASNIWRNPGEVPGNGLDDDRNGYVDDVHGIDTANGDSDPFDDHGHGTHTSGTAGAVANNATGIAGVSWNVRILPCKFMDSSGVGTDAAAIECFNYVLDQKARGVNLRVTSNSWGRPRSGDAWLLRNAIDAVGAAGVLNVFAAGNAGTNNDVQPFDPASFPSPSIVAVAASDQIRSDERASWSNYGAASVHVAAPGVNILSTFHDWYAAQSGTSMAAAHVAGAAAVLFAHRPQLTAGNAKDILTGSVDVVPQLTGVVAAGGSINLFRALQWLIGPGAPAVPEVAAPFSGNPVAIPGVVEAEHFDIGASGAAYSDMTPGNTGGAYRNTDVDLERSEDAGGGYNVGWMDAAEWLQYTVDVRSPGEYLLEMRVASDGPGGSLHVEVDGIPRSGVLRIPDTGGWQQWQTIATSIRLEAGVQRLRLIVDAAGLSGIVGNVNYLSIREGSAGDSSHAPGAERASMTIQAEDFDTGPGEGYADWSSGNNGGEYRNTDVDIEATSDAGGGYNVGWMEAGEWLQYTVDAGSGGLHTVEVRIASPGGGGVLHIEVDGTDQTGPLALPDTGGWQAWQSITTTITLRPGVQRIRIVLDSNGTNGTVGNLNYIRLTSS